MLLNRYKIANAKSTAAVKNDRGALALAATMLLLVFFGALGMGVDVAMWRAQHQQLQSAADSAAMAAMLAKIEGYSEDEIVAIAWQRAVAEGYTGDQGDFTVYLPPVDPEFADKNAVQIILSLALKRYFTGSFMEEAPQGGASAIAMSTEYDGSCVLALDTSDRGTLRVIGSADVRFVNCEGSTNSTNGHAVAVQGTATLSASCLSLVGALEDGRGAALGCSDPHENVAPLDDPFRFLRVPAASGACLEGPGSGRGHGAVTEAQILPGRYCGGLNLSGPTVAAPGTYIIDGGLLNISADASLAGIGVTFILTNGARASITGNPQINIMAPAAGEFAGVLFYADPEDDGLRHQVMASAASTLEGLIYMPEQHVEYSSGALITPRCTLIVAQTIEFQDDSSLADDCAYLGMQASLSRAKVALVK